MADEEDGVEAEVAEDFADATSVHERWKSGLDIRASKDGVQFCECPRCIYVHDGGNACDVYPEGIPLAILIGEELHHTPRDDQDPDDDRVFAAKLFTYMF